ncbi:hypothetical protein MRX96_020818 [Rhipicephalus microplus]
MSDNSMSEFDDTSDDDAVPSTLGVQPYLYEPSREAANAEQSQQSTSEPSPDASRRLSTEWCHCHHCAVIDTCAECICCTKQTANAAKIQGNQACVRENAAVCDVLPGTVHFGGGILEAAALPPAL